MKTTLEIDEELYREAKAIAALTGRKMKDLVGDGLRWVVQQPRITVTGNPALGCLKRELAGRSVSQLMDELRGTPDFKDKPKNQRRR